VKGSSMKTIWILGAAGALTLVPAVASADDASATCEEPHDLDKYQLLRRLSLDLRGEIPSLEEYDALDAEEVVPATTVQQYLETDEFRMTMRRYHELMFWPNVSNVRLNNQNALLGLKAGPALRIQAASRASLYRGDPDATCGDFQQTDFDPAYPGQFRPKPGSPEGWRMVSPYWDPGNPVKVCAYDAQETKSVGGVECNTLAGNADKACGCGPNLDFCYAPSQAASKLILASLREQLARAVDDVVTGGAPYTDLLLSTKAWQNGPIAFWKKNLAPNLSYSATYNVADPDEEVLAKDYLDETWTQVDRKGSHAGVLTLPAYLLRFQTDRGRANRFRITFMCEYFVPPAKLDPAPGCDPAANDLTQRCNCQYCHQKLEPLASYFGLFAEAGSTFMSEASGLPNPNMACKGKGSAFCKRFYVTDAMAHNPGALLSLQWADLHTEYQTNSEAGPRALAQSIVDDGTFAHCTVRKAFAHFVKRDMRAQGAETDELALLDSLADGFAKSGYSFPWLVQELVSLPQYRRVR